MRTNAARTAIARKRARCRRREFMSLPPRPGKKPPASKNRALPECFLTRKVRVQPTHQHVGETVAELSAVEDPETPLENDDGRGRRRPAPRDQLRLVGQVSGRDPDEKKEIPPIEKKVETICLGHHQDRVARRSVRLEEFCRGGKHRGHVVRNEYSASAGRNRRGFSPVPLERLQTPDPEPSNREDERARRCERASPGGAWPANRPPDQGNGDRDRENVAHPGVVGLDRPPVAFPLEKDERPQSEGEKGPHALSWVGPLHFPPAKDEEQGRSDNDGESERHRTEMASLGPAPPPESPARRQGDAGPDPRSSAKILEVEKEPGRPAEREDVDQGVSRLDEPGSGIVEPQDSSVQPLPRRGDLRPRPEDVGGEEMSKRVAVQRDSKNAEVCDDEQDARREERPDLVAHCERRRENRDRSDAGARSARQDPV